jgi:CAAX prenyl protease-like protein
MIVLLAIGLGTELFSNGFNWFHPIQYIFAALALAVVLPSTESFKVGSIPFALIAGVLVAVLWVYITPANAQQNLLISSKLLSLGVLGDFWLGAKLLGYVIIVPISEELAFRGFFVRWIKSRDFRSVELRSTSTFALIASSFIFGMFHQNLMLGAIAGVCFGWVAKRGNSVWDAVFAHVVANGLIAAYAYHAGMWVILS